VNGSFVFGMDEDDAGVFDRTVEWAILHGLETATFHILTPYPGTALYHRMSTQSRILHRDWDLYDTRHCVFQPAKMTPEQLEEGYWRAYREFYRWSSIARSAMQHAAWVGSLRHFAYAAGWKKFEGLWDLVLRCRRVASMRPVLEAVLQPPSTRLSGHIAQLPTNTRITTFLPERDVGGLPKEPTESITVTRARQSPKSIRVHQ
jgi:hypothetical protein